MADDGPAAPATSDETPSGSDAPSSGADGPATSEMTESPNVLPPDLLAQVHSPDALTSEDVALHVDRYQAIHAALRDVLHGIEGV